MRKHSPDVPVGLTGYEAVEFLDIPTMGETLHAGSAVARSEPRARLNEVTQSHLARQAYEYISRLVRNSHGDDEDVRSVVHVLQARHHVAES